MLNRALVVNMNYLGDALMTTPALEAIHRATGIPSVVVAGGAVGYGALEALRGNPDVGRLIPRVNGNGWARCLQLWRLLREEPYGAVVILPSIPVYRWAARLAGVKRIVYVPPSPQQAHLAAHMLGSVASQLGVAPGPLQMRLTIQPAAQENVARQLAEIADGYSIVGLNIGATRPQKRWQTRSFASLAARLAARRCACVLIGGPGDVEAADEICRHLDRNAPVINLCGKTTIAELEALVERCDVLVTGDSGAMHIAAAVGTPLVALFGSTDPEQTGPVGGAESRVIYKRLYCAPCKSHPTCGGTFECLTSISPFEALGAVQELLPRKSSLVDAPPLTFSSGQI